MKTNWKRQKERAELIRHLDREINEVEKTLEVLRDARRLLTEDTVEPPHERYVFADEPGPCIGGKQ